jgi:hypothetical protein
MISWDDVREIVVLDTEYRTRPGDRPEPVALVAHLLRSGQVLPYFEDQLRTMRTSPLPDGPDVLHVAFAAQAEWATYLALGWPLPHHVVDLSPEFRLKVNWALSKSARAKLLPYGAGLIGAMAFHGLPFMGEAEKEAERAFILRGGGPYPGDRGRILGYCEQDALGTSLLFGRMRPEIHLGRALVRGGFTKATAHIEHAGIPLDVPMFDRLRALLDPLMARFIADLDRFGFYEDGHLRERRLADWIARQGYHDWPRTRTGKPALDEKTLGRMARAHSDARSFRDLRKIQGELRALRDLPIGRDGRNRCSLWPFSTSTGRNAPSGKEFILNLAAWCRGLIRPGTDRAIAYLDYRAQEYAIAAYLSGDPAMIRAYESGRDPYLEFGRQIGLVPDDATRESRPRERKLLKEAVLGTQYGQGALGLARKIGWPESRARLLLAEVWGTYPLLRRWLEGAVSHATAFGRLHTCFGWEVIHHTQSRVTTLMNWPIQSHAAEMLRWACGLAIDRGLTVIAPLHDAILIEGPSDTIDHLAREAERAMGDAASIVLGGPRLATDPKVTRWPDRFQDETGWATWCRIIQLVESLKMAG